MSRPWVAAELPRALLVRDDDALRAVMTVVLQLAAGSAVAGAVPLDVRGTAFQTAVWAALRTIPAGHTRSYAEVAAMLQRPAAVRAVARACAANAAALVVPRCPSSRAAARMMRSIARLLAP